MKQLKSVSVKKFVGLLVLLAASVSYSAIVFEGNFRGPGNGAGGPYDLINLGGKAVFINDTANHTVVGVSDDNPMGDGDGYIRCAITNYPSSSDATAMITITPESAATSLDAMTDVVNGDRVINGGFDFFFRSNEKILSAEMRTLDKDNRGNNGIRLIFLSQSPGLRVEIISPTDGLLSDDAGGGATNFKYASGAFSMESNTVYHLGLTFETDASGNVTAKVWAQEGTGAIDLTTASPIASVTFGIDENIVTSGFYTGEYSLGNLRMSNISYTSMVQEYDQFRIYNSTPTSFGALEKAATPTWRDSDPEVVLQADFNGDGTGTGGKDNMVTFGGTATLADGYANSSIASVIDTEPLEVANASSSGGYLNVVSVTNQPNGNFGRARITPSSPETSWAAMTVNTNGHIILRGGIDFFFRNNHDISVVNEFRAVDISNTGNDGLRLTLYDDGPDTFKCEIITSGSGLYVGGEGGSIATSIIYEFPAQIKSNTLYHFGVSFDGTDTGDVTATIWQKEGTGEIDLQEDLPIGSLTFGINESVVTNGLPSSTFNFGKIVNNCDYPSVQDFDTFRIYNDTPIVFGELPVPSTGTLIIVN